VLPAAQAESSLRYELIDLAEVLMQLYRAQVRTIDGQMVEALEDGQ
jgi:hypothetical protein